MAVAIVGRASAFWRALGHVTRIDGGGTLRCLRCDFGKEFNLEQKKTWDVFERVRKRSNTPTLIDKPMATEKYKDYKKILKISIILLRSNILFKTVVQVISTILDHHLRRRCRRRRHHQRHQ